VSVALDYMLEYTNLDTEEVGYLVPWFVREIVPVGAACRIFLAGGDIREAEESAEVIAQRLLDCQQPEPEEEV
jgi:hypothetical protein